MLLGGLLWVSVWVDCYWFAVGVARSVLVIVILLCVFKFVCYGCGVI